MKYADFDHIDLGPLEPLLDEADLSEIMVNGMHGVYVNRRGHMEARPDVVFKSDAHIEHIMQQIAFAAGRDLSAQNPIVDVRLPDESRIHLVVPPVAVDGPVLTIRRFNPKPLTLDDVVRFGSIDEKLVTFFRALFAAPINVVIAGGTASGKTTMQNILLGLVPPDERIIAVERIVELRLTNPHLVRLGSVPPNPDGTGGIGVLELLKTARHMRPDRIVMPTVEGPEAWEMLHIMSDGYDGSCFSMHAENPQDALERLEMMSTAASNLPLLQIRTRIAQTVRVLIQQSRLRSGKRRVVSVMALQGMSNNVINTVELMRYEATGTDADGNPTGDFVWTGRVPDFADMLDLPDGFFAG